MADTLITGTTLIEKESRSIGDVPIGGIVEFDETLFTIPDGYAPCDGATITDPLSSYNGTAVPNLNTEYYSVPATEFKGLNPDTDALNYSIAQSSLTTDGAGIFLQAPINLPNGAVVTACIVYGNAGATAETWTLTHTTITSGSGQTTMATANVDTEDTTITDATIDNSTDLYQLETTSMDATDIINSALITFTPRKKFIIRIK